MTIVAMLHTFSEFPPFLDAERRITPYSPWRSCESVYTAQDSTAFPPNSYLFIRRFIVHSISAIITQFPSISNTMHGTYHGHL